MNWLGHLLVLPDEGLITLGNLLGDFIKGRVDTIEPRDLRIDTMSFRINDPDRSKPSIGSRLTQGAIVAFADGHVAPTTIKEMAALGGDNFFANRP